MKYLYNIISLKCFSEKILPNTRQNLMDSEIGVNAFNDYKYEFQFDFLPLLFLPFVCPYCCVSIGLLYICVIFLCSYIWDIWVFWIFFINDVEIALYD